MWHGQMKPVTEELRVTYGAVSRQVHGLELTPDVSLFEGPRNKLTPIALELQPTLQEEFDSLQNPCTNPDGFEVRIRIVGGSVRTP